MSSQTITLVVSPRGKPIKTLPHESEVPRNAPATELYNYLATASGTSVHRLRITKGSNGQLVPNRADVSINQTGLMDGSKVFVKDLGPQISWRTVFVLEYLGPLIIHPLVYLLRPYIYASPNKLLPFPAPSSLQTLSLLLVSLHFVKREYETVYVHRFSSVTMPLRNIFENTAYYWVIAGLNMAYWIYRPNAPAAKAMNVYFTLPGVLLFFVGQVGNFSSHLTLRDLRSSGGKERGIPQGLWFEIVTCPNYMFETIVWVGVCLVTRDLSTVIFLIASMTMMCIWAKKKERNYRKEFGDKYKKKRSTFLPGIF
ncbi:3-oxo-5a-steroid 4- dehydrogenase [Xylographa carneopallida]|nr:3-oxo-5a-steroid 4- dehydrogenase [Xylographa carneopallida]